MRSLHRASPTHYYYLHYYNTSGFLCARVIRDRNAPLSKDHSTMSKFGFGFCLRIIFSRVPVTNQFVDRLFGEALDIGSYAFISVRSQLLLPLVASATPK